VTEFTTTGVSSTELKEKLDIYKNDPTAIQTTVIKLLEKSMNGELEIVDPTNPFVFLLESSSVTASTIMDAYIKHLRLQYPRLIGNMEDLYHHLSDIDYLGRFAVPAETTISFMIFKNDIRTKGYYDADENSYSFIIPRNTICTANGFDFLIIHPIIVKEYDNGSIIILRDLSVENPLEISTKAVVPYVVQTISKAEQWIHFDIPVKQLTINSHQFSVMNSSIFKETIRLQDQFVYAEAYIANTTTGWDKIITTHSDMVFDQNKPTVLLKLLEDSLEINIPPIYLLNGSISNNLRIDVYTTKGRISSELSQLTISDWSRRTVVVDENRDSNQQTSIFNTITHAMYSPGRVDGGRNILGYKELRERLFKNVLGPIQKPITTNDVEELLDRDGYSIIKAEDVVNTRTYMAIKELPKPEISGIRIAAIPTIGTLHIDIERIEDTSRLLNHQTNRYTLLNNTIIKENNGVLSIMTDTEYTNIISKPEAKRVEVLNREKLWYSPFYYVLDYNDNEFSTRVYSLDQPVVKYVNWVNRNPIEAIVSTDKWEISKVPSGYLLRITTISDDRYKALPANTRHVQAVIFLENSTKVYLNGSLIGTTPDNEYIFEFLMTTNHDIDSDGNIYLTNLTRNSVSNIKTGVPLDVNISIFYITDSNTVTHDYSEMDNRIGADILPTNSIALTEEEFVIKLGYNLENLWNRGRMYWREQVYKKYPADVVATYPRDIYERDPDTGAPFVIETDNNGDCTGVVRLNILHYKGDPILDALGNPIILHKKGDAIIDSNGDPVLDMSKGIAYEIDMFLIEGVYHFANAENYDIYREEIERVLRDRVMTDMEKFNNVMLDHTTLKYGANKTYGYTSVIIDGNAKQTNTRKKVTTILRFTDTFLLNDGVREKISEKVSDIIDSNFRSTIINLDNIRSEINDIGDMIKGINLYIDGESVNGIIEITKDGERLAINRVPTISEDGKIAVTTAVDIQFS